MTPHQPIEPLFLTVQQVALMCGLSTDTIYAAINRGDLIAVRPCSRLRIYEHDFHAWLRAHTTGPSTDADSVMA